MQEDAAASPTLTALVRSVIIEALTKLEIKANFHCKNLKKI